MTQPVLTSIERQQAIELAHDQCERCGWLAWSYTRSAQLELRERDDSAQVPHVFCAACAARFDVRLTKRKAPSGRSNSEAA